MTSLIYTSTFVLISFSFLLSPVSSSLHHLQPSEGFEQADSSFEEKTRLGSVPPSCHNKCNRCHPCMAVQVATSPSQHHVFEPAAGFSKATITNPPMKVFHPSSDQYTNYKPLGWKCRCGNNFYNP